jgi:Fe-S cluster biogenesis protein NfuA
MSALRAAVERRLAEIAPALRAHAGGVELTDVSDDGVVALRFTGMCTGCPFRPLTTAATLRPALLSVPGVRALSVPGARISEEAEERLARYLA